MNNAQTYSWQTILGPMQATIDADGITFVAQYKTTHLRWANVSGGGVMRPAQSSAEGDVPQDVWGEIGGFLPGLKQVFDVNDELADRYRQLVLGAGRRYGSILRIPYPIGDAQAEALVAEVASRLGTRWRGELSQTDYHKQLGARFPWWGAPVSILFLVALTYAVSMTCVVGYAVSEGDFALLREWYVWPGIALWFGLVGSILWMYRRRWLK